MQLLEFTMCGYCSGLPSPKFAVTTPARKETNRISRKRKTLFDETIVLSNE